MTSLKRKSDLPPSGQNKRLVNEAGTDGDNNINNNAEQSQSTTAEKPSGFLAKLMAFILPACIEKARLEIFKTQIVKNGGKIVTEFDSNSNSISHVIVDDKMDMERVMRIMKLDTPPHVPVVKSMWLSSCLKSKCFLSFQEYELAAKKVSPEVLGEEQRNTSPVSFNRDAKSNVCLGALENGPQTSDTAGKQHFGRAGFVAGPSHQASTTTGDSDSDYIASDDDNDEEQSQAAQTSSNFPLSSQKPMVPVDKWICAQSSKSPKPNLNKHITDKLEEMVKAYESTNDRWRAFGYQKAVQALRRHPKVISSWEEAMALPAIGKRLADKIWEIAESGELRKLQELKSSEEVRVLETFTNVWGAGPTTAQQWFQQGFRTIEDLKEKAHLTHQQKVGVRLYQDLLDRMPREEAAEIEKVVREAAESIQEGVVAQACGSYRRGKATCGDVDVLVTHPDGRSHKGLFSKLLAKLKDSGFLTDDLVSAEDAGNQKKYLGVCKLPGENTKHRRLDIIVVPYSEYGCALVYFTGSAHFNRSLRHLCKKSSMSLNEHALKSGVVRKGAEKIYEGTVIPTPTEKSVFEALNVPYRPPEERDH
ncbi:DNA polymerase lambda [Aplysia californica]|uniref:DNA polymerase n=1 Tax=Aplysia californica TaxID=6500 RepID=A0ABM0JE64_APLCA|nr:DNA polymerase lambda [Aplysia californica]